MSAMGDRRRVVLLFVLVALLALLQDTAALKCRTEDGPSSDEVRKVIRVCMKQITTEAENKSSDEYEDYDSSYSDTESDEQDGKNGAKQSEGSHRNDARGKNSDGDRNGGSRSSGKNDDRRMSEGRNRKKSNDRDQDWDYNGHGPGRRGGDGRNQQSGRYKRQYYNDGSQGGYGYSYQQNDRYNRDRETFMNPGANNSSTNSSENPERDRACLMQCFFQEMKMTNSEGFPDKHKVLHVVTKDLRDHELKDFYIDSIQECFHMIGMDNKLKDKCDYSMKFVTCLAERGQANCNDWENEAIMF
ncbi:general odorant-binding protein 71 [Culex quinquefasciatus]|uniref:general odorant-binding protein 71 n=1 Tax=Culex quinquefasciatus TaxID=7176 RepID=UPI0018E30174|nr:general odorant-binding protein 71 [Culex quinquefasciatus]